MEVTVLCRLLWDITSYWRFCQTYLIYRLCMHISCYLLLAGIVCVGCSSSSKFVFSFIIILLFHVQCSAYIIYVS